MVATMRELKIFLLLVPIFLAVDLTWLGVIMRNFYSAELGELARRRDGGLAPRWSAAILVYVLIPGGLVLFVRPLLGAEASWLRAAAWGAVYGLITYGIYDLTNLATLERWTVRLSAADMAWGAVLCGLSAMAMHWIDGRLG